jgi:hypothetical protein
MGPHAPGAGRTWAFADSDRLRLAFADSDRLRLAFADSDRLRLALADSDRLRLRHTRLSYAPRLPMTRMAQRDSDKSDRGAVTEQGGLGQTVTETFPMHHDDRCVCLSLRTSQSYAP